MDIQLAQPCCHTALILQENIMFNSSKLRTHIHTHFIGRLISVDGKASTPGSEIGLYTPEFLKACLHEFEFESALHAN